ncbi:MAG: DMT family transporter [Acidobacteria bacterium]|uniref:DMT family transporter n=1 Tax=Candidatus Polarisedimenticola svalbardensis TaxID=2886004 RepID=A0A8J7CDR5_9BACT|nr:DMT family transporter [Candidatus Polarisedimenticola svalbardensis]
MQDYQHQGSAAQPLIRIAIGAVCISFAPVLVKAVGGGIPGPTGIGMYRCLIGAALLFLAALHRRDRLLLPGRVMALLALAGFIFFLDLFVWHRSIILAGAGMATILGNTQVFATAVLSLLLFKEKLTGRFILAAVSAMAGVILLVGIGSDVTFDGQYLKGIVFGLLTGIVYASFLITIRQVGRIRDNGTNLTRIAWISLFSGMFLGIAALVERDLGPPPDLKTWSLLFLLALVAQSAGWLLIARSLPKVPGAVGGLLLLLQPVLATVWGAFLFREHLEPVQMIGAAVTLVAIYVGSLKR